MKKKYRLIIPCLIASTLTPFQVFGVEITKLRNAVETAITTNPEILRIYNIYESNYADKLSALGAGFLPSIDYSAAIYDESRRDPNTQNLNKDYTRTNRSISIRQNLFNGFFDYNNVKRLSHAARGKVFELENASQLIANDTTKAYVDLVRYRLLVKLAEDNYVTLKTLYEQLKLKSEAGIAKKSDLEQAQSRLSLADYNLTVEGSNLHDMEARYQRLVGGLPPKELDSNIQINKDIPKNVVEALAKAQENNPALIASFEDVEQQASERNTRASGLAPRVDLRAFKDDNINTNGVQNTNGSNGQFKNEGIGIEFTWNLFKGGADVNNIIKSQNLYEAALDNREKMCRDVREQLEVGYNDIKKYTDQVAYLDQRQIAIEKARDAYRKQFEINQRSLIDLLNAENELYDAKRAYLNATHDLAIAYSRTHTYMGTILQALNISRYKSNKTPNPNTKVDLGFASCPAIAPTPYQPDRKFLDQRANDALVPIINDIDLEALQNKISINVTNTPSKSNSGEIDLSTPEKIKEFQKSQGLPQTGVIGNLTRKALKRLQENVANTNAVPAEPTPAPVVEPTPAATETTNLSGEIDLSTPEKIKEFQKSQGLPQTGVIGNLTRKALKRLQENVANTNAVPAEPTPAPVVEPTPAATETTNLSGEIDLSTPEKIKEFQKSQGLPQTGVIGNLTRKALKRLQENVANTNAVPAEPTPAPVVEPTPAATETTNLSGEIDLSTPEKIKEFQKSQGLPQTGVIGNLTRKALKRLQENVANTNAVPAEPTPAPVVEPTPAATETTNLSGEIDLSTPEKIKEFQKSQGLPQTGVIGNLTRKALKRLQENVANTNAVPAEPTPAPVVEPTPAATETTNLSGEIDLSTPEKIKEFQKSQGLPQTGVIGNLTRKALKRLQENVANTNAVPAEPTPAPVVEPTPAATETTNLSGEIDLSTPEKIKEFQKSQGLPQTGKLDKRTKKALKNLKKKNEEKTNELNAPLENTNTINLIEPDLSTPEKIQEFSSPEKIKEFQKSQGISETGLIDEPTKKALKRFLLQNTNNTNTSPTKDITQPIKNDNN